MLARKRMNIISASMHAVTIVRKSTIPHIWSCCFPIVFILGQGSRGCPAPVVVIAGRETKNTRIDVAGTTSLVSIPT